MKLRDPSTMLVACYARFSTDRQDARSIDDQLRRCRDYAQGRGHQIVLEERDAAISGAHIDRDGLQRLLALATRRPPTFQAVLVDDLSRLSRDLGATWRIIFEDLAAAGVKVIDCALGIASDDPNARLVFGATALVNDTFLQIVRHETHRGLQGRALAGSRPAAGRTVTRPSRRRTHRTPSTSDGVPSFTRKRPRSSAASSISSSRDGP